MIDALIGALGLKSFFVGVDTWLGQVVENLLVGVRRPGGAGNPVTPVRLGTYGGR